MHKNEGPAKPAGPEGDLPVERAREVRSGFNDEPVELRVSRDDLSAVKRILSGLNGGGDASRSWRAAAENLLQQRRARGSFFPAAMFAEHAWDMLLALYAGARKSYVAADLARAVGAKPTTALRWQDYLETHGLIERSAHPLDSRAHLLQLTEAARRQIESYLEAFGSKDV